MFPAALFILAPNWGQPKCPLTGKWIIYGVATQWNAAKQNQKNYKYMPQHGGSSKAFC